MSEFDYGSCSTRKSRSGELPVHPLSQLFLPLLLVPNPTRSPEIREGWASYDAKVRRCSAPPAWRSSACVCCCWQVPALGCAHHAAKRPSPQAQPSQLLGSPWMAFATLLLHPGLPLPPPQVDLFSLGVMAFELWHPFATAMERAVLLRDLREHGVMPVQFEADHPVVRPAVCAALPRSALATCLLAGFACCLPAGTHAHGRRAGRQAHVCESALNAWIDLLLTCAAPRLAQRCRPSQGALTRPRPAPPGPAPTPPWGMPPPPTPHPSLLLLLQVCRLIRWLMAPNPAERPTAVEVLRSELLPPQVGVRGGMECPHVLERDL